MFKRLTFDNGHTTLAIVAFVLTAAVFAVAVWRALRLKPEEKDHLAHLPLENDPTIHPQPANSHRHGRTETS